MADKIHIHTFGCQMNNHDSEKIYQLMQAEGFVKTDNPKHADIILLNTCSIREKPEHKVYSLAGRLRTYKEESPNLILGIGGCVAQQEKEKIFEKMPFIDLVFGTHNIDQIPEMIRSIKGGKKNLIATKFRDEEFKFVKNKYNYFENKYASFVTIMNGCDNFCAYCIVPYVRGREVSRDSAEIIQEIMELAASGIKEVTLIGQNVNSYNKKNGDDTLSFEKLLIKIHAIEGIERIRFITSHPKDISDELISLFGTLPKLCHHIHLPIQSGSNKILELMRRQYTKERYLEITEKLYRIDPKMAISTDIIVGFPEETEEDFQETIELVKKTNFDSIFSFKYSARPYTKAANFPDSVEEEIKQRRLFELQTLQNEISANINSSLENTFLKVLVEGYAVKEKKQLSGRSETNKVVNMYYSGKADLMGKIVKVKILRGYKHSLLGEIIL